MLAVTSDVETVKRFGGWKSDVAHAYLYTDLAAASARSREMLSSKPVFATSAACSPFGSPSRA